MKKENYHFEPAAYKLFIYYNDAEHPTSIERNSTESLVKWLENKHNKHYLSNCKYWVIKDDKGEEVKKGKVSIETKIIVE